MNFPIIVGDIGGTNARFGIVRDIHSELELFEPVLTDDFPDVESAIEKAVLAKTSIIPKGLVLAAAGPIMGKEYKLTNAGWTIKPPEVLKALNLTNAVFMNDFPAQALAVVTISQSDMHKVGGGNFREYGTRVVLGPGTSFGISTLVYASGKWTILPAEGACADLGLGTGMNAKRELQIQSNLKKVNERQTIEYLISGPGLENLYQAICKTDGVDNRLISAAQISNSTTSNNAANEAVELFSALLGRVAGNLALNVMATGGVYVTGGMAHKMLHQIEQGGFRREFEYKAPHSELAKTFSTWFVNRENAALEGLANYVRTPDSFDLSHASIKFSS